jgi:uncharacterized membrane protein YccC
MRNIALMSLSRLSRALFRTHIENGLSVTIAMGCISLGAAWLFGIQVAALAVTGALCASVVDTPGRAAIRTRMFALAIGGTAALTAATILAGNSHALMLLVVAAMSFVSGLISALGRRALGLGTAAVLVILYATSGTNDVTPVLHVAIFSAGGVAYAVLAQTMAALLEDRNRRLLLGEALLAFAAYVDAKAVLFDPRTRTRLSLQSLIETHETFVEHLQGARDLIFAGRSTPARLRLTAALTALLDCFDMILSGDADIETLRQSPHRHMLERLGALTADIAVDVRKLVFALVTPGVQAAHNGHERQLQAITEEIARLELAYVGQNEPLDLAALRSAGHKLALTVARMKRLAEAINGQAGPVLPGIDFSAFVQRESMSPKVLSEHIRLSSPAMRYAIRLTLAMSCGFAITLVLPDQLHSGWVLLTTMLIMRTSYSITKRRRNDRVVGTVLGCIVAAVLVMLLPLNWLFVPILIAIGASHAFATVEYRVTALSASVTALLAVHFLAPQIPPLFIARIFDTLIGALLAWLFSFLLPSWEWRKVPRLVTGLAETDAKYALLALKRRRNDQAFRLARKRAHDAAATLSAAVRRLVDEPQADRATLVVLNDLLSANYLLASDLASMRVLFRLRGAELDPVTTDSLLETTRNEVAHFLSAKPAKDVPVPRLSRRTRGENLGGPNAMTSLRRRLVHIERSAERVGALAAKVV